MKRVLFSLATLASLAVLTACAPMTPPAPMANKYASADHAAFIAGGKGAINGQAFLRQRGGGTVTCAGEPAMALPATPYFKELVAAFANRQAPDGASGAQAAIREVGKKTTCDAQGNFSFSNLAPGQWLVFTEVKWTVGQYNRQGGPVLKSVEVREGEPTRAILSNEDRYP